MKDLENILAGIELVDSVEPYSPDMRCDLWVVGEQFGSRLDRFVGVLVYNWVDICRLVGIRSVFESFLFVQPSIKMTSASHFMKELK